MCLQYLVSPKDEPNTSTDQSGFFSGGGENDVCGATLPRGCGVCSPRKFLKWLLGPQRGWKLATNKLISIKNSQLQILGDIGLVL